MASIRESAHGTSGEGTWLALAADADEVVRVLIPHRQDPDLGISLWWSGSASPSVVRDWVADTIKTLNPDLECHLKILANDAPENSVSYRVQDVGQIANDIQKWANDGAVACSIVEGPQHSERVYMWAELNEQGAQKHIGEVGLHFHGAGAGLDTKNGRYLFHNLLTNTTLRQLSEEEIGTLFHVLDEKISIYS